MPALTVSLDGKHLATVCTDGYDHVSVHLRGSRIEEHLAVLTVTGGTLPEGGEPTYLTWVNSLPLAPGQVVEVAFIEHGATSHRGQTIDELREGEPREFTAADFKPMAEALAELRAKPSLREKFCFRLEASSGTRFAGETSDDAFALHVHWDSFNPERARLSLHSYTFDMLEQRGPLNYQVKERMPLGSSVRFEVA